MNTEPTTLFIVDAPSLAYCLNVRSMVEEVLIIVCCEANYQLIAFSPSLHKTLQILTLIELMVEERNKGLQSATLWCLPLPTSLYLII